MFSFGTDCDFALAMASARVGFPVGSPPPVLAATSIDLISLANSLPRRASMTAFLCLVVAHLLWPLMFHLVRRRRPSRYGGRLRLPPALVLSDDSLSPVTLHLRVQHHRDEQIMHP